MSRNPSGVYQLPSGTYPQAPNTTVESIDWNQAFADLEQDANIARPIVAGGTGATTIAGARSNLGAEAARQVVTNYDMQVFENGSFVSAAGATAAPTANAFMGFSVVNDANNLVLEGYDQVTGKHYVRLKVAGVWINGGAWSDISTGQFVLRAGDTMSGNLTIAKAAPQLFINTTDTAQASQVLLQEAGVTKALFDYIGSTFATPSLRGLVRVGNLAGGPISFLTNSTDRMWIAADGKVGVNTITPQTQFDVHLGVNLNAGIGSNTYPGLFSHNDNFSAWGNLQLNVSMYILGASGFVGINVTNPTALLHLRAPGAVGTPAEALRLDNTVNDFTSGATGVYLTFYGGLGTKELSRITGYQVAGTGGEGELAFHTRFSEAMVERMRLKSSGAVVIGNTAGQAASMLTVDGGTGPGGGITSVNALGATTRGLFRGITTAASGTALSIQALASVSNLVSSIDFNTDGAANNGALIFATSIGGVSTERMRMNSAGNIAINNATLTRQLSIRQNQGMKLGQLQGLLVYDGAGSGGIIVGSDFNQGKVQGTNAAGGAVAGLMLQHEGGNLGIGNNAHNADALLYLSNDNNPTFIINAMAGHPIQKFRHLNVVDCAILHNGDGSGTAGSYIIFSNKFENVGVHLPSGTNAWVAWSDARIAYKRSAKDVTTTLPPLDDYFLYENANTAGVDEVFVKAQELNTMWPQAVYAGKGDNADDPNFEPKSIADEGVWGVFYDRLGAIALAYIKDHAARIAALEAAQ
jgi:hypothetical protein